VFSIKMNLPIREYEGNFPTGPNHDPLVLLCKTGTLTGPSITPCAIHVQISMFTAFTFVKHHAIKHLDLIATRPKSR
jgi:hypothetical protein